MSGAEELRAAVAELHAKLDAWHAVVEGVAAESDDDPTRALADPRLEAAQDAFYDRLGAFEAASLPVLGMVVLEGEGAGDEDALREDDFFLHLVVGVGDGEAADRLGTAFDLVNDAGDDLSERLSAAGFVVRHMSASRGELALDEAEDEGPE